ncbi:helix-turn-helix domain-containing protein [Eubacterium xylanophilum]|uniref:helix-turn-helix domain-containing protein n=1 Tax=Eubacterium xylanophilum TaxID=39497 RepID=UPI0005597B94|nr:helix-turn-helix transcriptional regulator [Eubacterium xylanophilum]
MVDRFNSEVGRRIREIRRFLDISVEDMCQDLEVSERQLYRIERGECSVSVYGLMRFHERHGVDLNYLLTGVMMGNDIITRIVDSTLKEKAFIICLLADAYNKEVTLRCKKREEENRGEN